MGIGDSNGNAPWLKSRAWKKYEKRVEKSRRMFWKNQEELPLNQLLVLALQEKGVSNSYIKRARYLPIEYCIRGPHYATDGIIFSDDDFRRVNLALDYKVNLDRYIDGLTAGVNPTLLIKRPVLGASSEGRIIVPVNMLSKGYWAWFSEANIEGKREPICEVWPYEAGLSDWGFSENPYQYHYGYLGFYARRRDSGYLGFYARRKDGKLGWTYFPFRSEEKSKLEKLLK